MVGRGLGQEDRYRRHVERLRRGNLDARIKEAVNTVWEHHVTVDSKGLGGKPVQSSAFRNTCVGYVKHRLGLRYRDTAFEDRIIEEVKNRQERTLAEAKKRKANETEETRSHKKNKRKQRKMERKTL